MDDGLMQDALFKIFTDSSNQRRMKALGFRSVLNFEKDSARTIHFEINRFVSKLINKSGDMEAVRELCT